MTITPKNIAVIGSNGAIGSAFVRLLSKRYPDANLSAFSRSGVHAIDYNDESSIAKASDLATSKAPLDVVITATGILHDGDIMPEKSIRALSAKKLHHVFAANAIVPALVVKHFLPKLQRQTPSIFATLSARVGSISDNKTGGWYAYRASKAALNMILKNAAIEIKRCNKQAIVVGLHPGTVDSPLSKKFQHYVDPNKLFTPDDAVEKLWTVLENLTNDDSGKLVSWDGQELSP